MSTSISPMKEKRTQVSNNREGLWVGPISPADFLQEFLPKSKHLPPRQSRRLLSRSIEQATETTTGEPFVQFIKNNRLIPGFQIVNPSDHPRIKSRNDNPTGTNLLMYARDVNLTNNGTEFDKLELNIKFMSSLFGDPFYDPEGSTHRTKWISESERGEECLGQLTEFVTEWCSRQHRTFAFTILIFGRHARFIRWDRSGAVVSRKFDYKEQSQYLVDFLWRFVHLTPGCRGKDTTVRDATPEEEQIATDKLAEWKIPGSDIPLVVYCILDGCLKREFVGWGATDGESLTGRATRACPVWDIQQERICFLKDSWRETYREAESSILRWLNFKEVRHVPTLICGGDIYEHTTSSQRFAATEFQDAYGMNERIHHRFVVDFVGRPLCTFKSSYILVTAVLQAYIGHMDAFKKCGVLHCDISEGNIMFDENWNGVLIDWDLAEHHHGENKNEITGSHYRMGTRRFMSALSLIYPEKPHSLQDDIESFLWVIIYCILRYCEHNLPFQALISSIGRIFDDYQEFQGACISGYWKYELCVARGSLGERKFALTENAPLTLLYYQMFGVLAQWQEYAANTPGAMTLWNARPGLNRQPLRDHNAVLAVMCVALQAEGWPIGDGAIDNLQLGQEEP